MSMAESLHHFNDKAVIVVMGSSGCGKSTIAETLSARLSLPYIEGDDVHPASNVEKMSRGIALTDDDRWPWFDLLGAAMQDNIKQFGGTITACSALKRSYRDYLSTAVGAPTLFVYIDVSRAELLRRMQTRSEHYMPASLLDSQLAILEKPSADEFAICVDGGLAIDDIVNSVISTLAGLSS